MTDTITNCQRWGSGFLGKLSQDLMREFPDMNGFSKRNLEQIRRWHQFWSQHPAIAKQAASQLFAIPWWHHVVILSNCQNRDQARYYIPVDFEPGYAGKLNFYPKAMGFQQEHDDGR